MQLQLTPYFEKRLADLPRPIRLTVIAAVERCEEANSLSEIRHLKTLHAKKNRHFYRIRVGNYRIGFELIDGVLVFQNVGVRGDFYKEYPPS